MIFILLISLVALGYVYLGLSLYFIVYSSIIAICACLVYFKTRGLFSEMKSFPLHCEIFSNIFSNSSKRSSKLEKFLLKQGLSFQVMKDNNQYDDLMHIMKNKYDLLYWELFKKQNGNTKYMLNYLSNYYLNKYQIISSSLSECLTCSIVLTILFIAFHYLFEYKGTNLILFIVLLAFFIMVLLSGFLPIKDELFVDKKKMSPETLISLYILSYNNGLKEACEELEISENQINNKKYYKLIGFLEDIKRNNTMVGNLILASTIDENYPMKKLDISHMFYITISLLLFILVFGGAL